MSAIYGSDASSGVSNIVTKSTEEIDGFHIRIRDGSHDTIYHKIESVDADKKEYGWQYFDGHQGLISIQLRLLFWPWI